MRIPHLALVCLALAGCGDDAGPDSEEAANYRAPSGSESARPRRRTGVGFDGVEAVLAGEDRIYVWWQPLSVPEGSRAGRYRVRAEPSDAPDPTAQVLDTEPGVGFAVLEGLQSGYPHRVSVHALDQAGREDDNRMVLRAVPNPVRYVSLRAGEAGDGLGPATAWRSLNQALEETIDLPGFNLYVEGGRYQERLLLFDGVMVYGGFDQEFSVRHWDPTTAPTILSAPGPGDLVSVAPGRQWCGLSGVELDGGGHSGRGVVADDCRLQLAQVVSHDFQRSGVHLRGEEDQWSIVRVRMARCTIRDNKGEGVSIRGIADVQLESCTISGNGQEALEAEPLWPAQGRTAQIVIEGCQLVDNQDQAININLGVNRESPENNDVMRVALIGNQILRNQRTAVSVDVKFTDQAGIPLEVDVRDNVIEDNGGMGLHLDVDACGRWLVRDNQVTGPQQDPALRLSGDAAGALVLVEDNRLGPVAGVAADLAMAGTVVGTGNLLRSGVTPALHHSRGFVDRAAFEAPRGTDARDWTRPFAWLDWALPVRLSRPPGVVSSHALVFTYPGIPHRWPAVEPPNPEASILDEQSMWRCGLDSLAPGEEFAVLLEDGDGARYRLPFRRGAPWPTNGGALDVVPASDLVHLTVESPEVSWILRAQGPGPWRLRVDGPSDDHDGTVEVRLRRGGKVARQDRLPFGELQLEWNDLDLSPGAELRLELAADRLVTPLPLTLSLEHAR